MELLEQYQSREKLTNNLSSAIFIMKEAKPLLSSFGWMISLYGSVLTNAYSMHRATEFQGRDIDFIVTNKFDKVTALSVVLVFKQLGFEQVGKLEESLFANCVTFKKEGCFLDVQIRKVNLKF